MLCSGFPATGASTAWGRSTSPPRGLRLPPLRQGRFAKAGQFAGFTGLVPGEHSSGGSVHRMALTKTGNAHLRHQLCEPAWAYEHRPGVGARLLARPPGTVARAWAAQQRLTRRFRALGARKNVASVVAAAVARELACFLWAEMAARAPDGLLHASAHGQVPCPPCGLEATLRDAASLGAGKAVGSLRSPRPPGYVSSLFGP